MGSYLVSTWLFVALLCGIMYWIVRYEWPLVIQAQPHQKRFWVYTLVYPTIPFIVLLYLVIAWRSVSLMIPLYPFFASWLVDAGGYFAGNLFGRHKMCPAISPKKTWEGALGGTLALLIFHAGLEWYYPLTDSWLLVVVATVVVSAVAIAGDLFVSLLKRRQGVSDTGTALPGHGGLLDRFDSVLFIAMLLWGIALIRALV
jgi:CDP-diglyceride synthetase